MKIVELQAQAYRAPIDVPVRSSFGEMRDRPAVLIRAVADDGTTGWGETWCNFPTVGAEHRARLINETLAPIVREQAWKNPVEAFETLTQRLHILSIQAGEPGPIAQAIAGVDIALWDVFARQAGEPVWRSVANHFGDKDRDPRHPGALLRQRPRPQRTRKTSRRRHGRRPQRLQAQSRLRRRH